MTSPPPDTRTTSTGPQAEDLRALRVQLAEGHVQRAYAAIVGYMAGLRTRYSRGPWPVSALYQGHFDMTYFALFPPSLRSRDLKLAVVFDYATFGFEVWLSARNRSVQRRYCGLFKERGWTACRIVEPAVGVDAIVASEVAAGESLADPEALSADLQDAVASLLADLEKFLSANDPRAV